MKKNKFALFLLSTLLLIGMASALTGISNCTQLQAVNDNTAEDYYLMNDIDCSDTINWNSSTGFTPISITGTHTFDGMGHSISDLYLYRPSTGGQAPFSGVDGTIKNLRIININTTGLSSVAGLIGGVGSTTYVINVSVTGSVTIPSGSGHYIGGIAGLGVGGQILNSSFEGNIYSGSTSLNGAGGIVGGVQSNTLISQCYTKGTIRARRYVGGIVGYGNPASVVNCYSRMNVSSSDLSLTAGIMGGMNGGSSITNSYSMGNITGSDGVGGLVSGSCTSSYFDNETSGITITSCGTGLTTALMKQSSSFSGWDFTNVWSIYDGYTYPFLIGNEDIYPPIPALSSTINSPISTLYTTSDIFFNFTTSNPATCVYSLDEGATNNSMTAGAGDLEFTDLNSGLADGNYNAYAYCTDVFTQFDVQNVSFSKNANPPIITIVSPTDPIIVVNYTDLEVTLDENGYCEFSLDGGANISMNEVSPTDFTYNFTDLADEQHTIIVSCNDSVGNLNQTEISFEIETEAPEILITSPISKTYKTALIDIIVSIDEEGFCLFSFDDGVTNYSMEADETNTTFTASGSFTDGSYTLTLYCSDYYDHLNIDTLSFDVAIPETPAQTIYKAMAGAGAGLGLFILYIAQALPIFLIGIVAVGLIILIGYAIVKVIPQSIKSMINKK